MNLTARILAELERGPADTGALRRRLGVDQETFLAGLHELGAANRLAIDADDELRRVVVSLAEQVGPPGLRPAEAVALAQVNVQEALFG